MLKKVGIVAAAATAALVTLSPFAFAGNHESHHDRNGEVTNVWVDDDSVERDQVNVCDFDQDYVNSGTAAAVTQTQDYNCVNAGDGTTVTVPDPAPLPLPIP